MKPNISNVFSMVVKINFFSPVTRASFRVSSFDRLAFVVKLQGVKNQFPRC